MDEGIFFRARATVDGYCSRHVLVLLPPWRPKKDLPDPSTTKLPSSTFTHPLLLRQVGGGGEKHTGRVFGVFDNEPQQQRFLVCMALQYITLLG